MSRSRPRAATPPPEADSDIPEDMLEENSELDATPDDAMVGETPDEAADRIIAKYRSKARSPTAAIRSHCVECMGGQVREVARCTARMTCCLWPFRMGRNPFHGRAKK